jgi:hypothetical protein
MRIELNIMNIIEFLKEYEGNLKFKTESFTNDWKLLKDDNKDNIQTLSFLIEQMIERRFPFIFIKELFLLNPNNEELKNNPDLFKWSAAFHGTQAIKFFYENSNIKDDDAAITAAIINGRLDNLRSLEELGLNIFTEKHFCQAINRKVSIAESGILEYYVENVDKLQITEYSIKTLQKNSSVIDKFPEIEKLLKITLLKDKLDTELSSKDETKPTTKMKI